MKNLIMTVFLLMAGQTSAETATAAEPSPKKAGEQTAESTKIDPTKIDPTTARVLKLLEGSKTFEANFNQKVYDARKRLLNDSTGIFKLSRPGKFRWEVATPYEELLVANGETLWAVDVDLEQVTIQSIGGSLGDTPALLLSKVDVNLVEQFDVKYIGSDEDGKVVYQFLPKDKSSLFESMTLIFKKQELLELWLRDGLGQLTMVTFSDQKVNHDLPATTFQYELNEKFDIIDTREKNGT